MFVAIYPQLSALNVMGLATPQSAILSAVIFNALDHRRADPAGAEGRRLPAVGAAALLRRNLLIYGLGGLVVPFIGIKAIDLAVAALAPRLRRKPCCKICVPPSCCSSLSRSSPASLYPLAITGYRRAHDARSGARAAWSTRDGKVDRLGPDRPIVHRRALLPRPPVGDRRRRTRQDPSKTVDAPYNAATSAGSNLGPTTQEADRPRQGRRRGA